MNKKLTTDLYCRVSYALGRLGKAFNSDLIHIIVGQLEMFYGTKKLMEMVAGEADNISIEEAIDTLIINQ